MAIFYHLFFFSLSLFFSPLVLLGCGAHWLRLSGKLWRVHMCVYVCYPALRVLTPSGGTPSLSLSLSLAYNVIAPRSPPHFFFIFFSSSQIIITQVKRRRRKRKKRDEEYKCIKDNPPSSSFTCEQASNFFFSSLPLQFLFITFYFFYLWYSFLVYVCVCM